MTVHRGIRAAALLLAATLLVPATTSAGVPMRHRLTRLHVIPLAMGLNRIAHFATDGRPAQIVMAWRGNGNAHSYNLFLVVMPGGESDTAWNVVGVYRDPPKGDFDDTVADAPHTGEDQVRSVYFAHANLDGKPATLLMTATREWKESIPEAAVTLFEVYKLVHMDEGFGTADQFNLVEAFRSKDLFCNSDLAFAKQFGTALPRDFPVNRKDGCS